jgi:hypothetical protein
MASKNANNVFVRLFAWFSSLVGKQTANTNDWFSTLIFLDSVSSIFDQLISLPILEQICHLAFMTPHSLGVFCSSFGYSFFFLSLSLLLVASHFPDVFIFLNVGVPISILGSPVCLYQVSIFLHYLGVKYSVCCPLRALPIPDTYIHTN